MNCDDVRTALSARLDGETPTLPDDVVDAHLAGCEECQRWFSTVSSLGRQLKFNLAPEPQPSRDADEAAARVLDATVDFPQVASTMRARSLPLTLSRVVLAGLAVAFLVWAGVLLFGSTLGASLPTGTGSLPTVDTSDTQDAAIARLVMDAATTRFALGIGLAWAAWKPRVAGALLPIYLAMWAFGAGIATRDIVMGLVETSVDVPSVLGTLALHLVAVIALITCWLARVHTVTPLRQYWRWLTAQPVSFSRLDVETNSTFRAGD